MQIRKCLLAVCLAVAALSVQAAETDAQVKAREALQKKLKEIDAAAAVTNAPAVTNTPAVPNAPAEPVPPAAVAPAAAAVAVAATAEVGGVPTPADPAVIEKARESMRKKMDEVTAAELAADAAKQPSAQPPPNTKPQEIAKNPPANPPSKPPKQPTSLPPMDAPPLPISADKKQQLDALLTRYKADQITPDQYQAERAKILQGN